MSGTTNFQQWNPSAVNQETDSQYTLDALRSGGVPSGAIVGSPTFNKAMYQQATFTAAFAQALANKGYSVTDDNFSNLVAAFQHIRTDADVGASILTITPGSTVTFPTESSTQFDLTLNQNVTSSYLTGPSSGNPAPGQLLLFVIAQDATGGRTFAWPSNITTPGSICPLASSISVQSFIVRANGAIVPAGAMIWLPSAGLRVNQVSVIAVSASGTVVASAAEIVEVVNASAGTVTRTLPASSLAPGAKINIKKIDSSTNGVAITANSGDVIDGAYTNYTIFRQGDSLTVVSDGVGGWWII